MKKIITDIEFNIDGKTAVAIGKFDGIHRGHEKLLKELLWYRSQGYLTAVFTFDRPFASYFTGKEYPVLTTLKEKEEYLTDLGIDILVEYPLTVETVTMEPEEFIRVILKKSLHAGIVIAGPDCSFGNKGSGNIALLQAMEAELSYETVVIDKETDTEHDGREISSSYVREEVEKGNMEQVSRLLGRNYSISGKVMHGRRLGRKLDMPTVNLIPDHNKLLPPFGVYMSEVFVGTKKYDGITNIGKKPTVSDHETVTVETYLYDFDDTLYGEYIRVELLKFSRGEQKFDSISQLKERLLQDMKEGDEFRRKKPCQSDVVILQ